MEGMALSKTLFTDTPVACDHENVPSAVFTQPQVGHKYVHTYILEQAERTSAHSVDSDSDDAAGGHTSQPTN
eukprot:339670-Pyramimonas_sp.AAC.1